MRDAGGAMVSAVRHARKAKRTTGRVFLSALGFSVAYFLDLDNGAARRKRVHEFVVRTVVDLDEVLTPELGLLRPIQFESPLDPVRRLHPTRRPDAPAGGLRLVASG